MKNWVKTVVLAISVLLSSLLAVACITDDTGEGDGTIIGVGDTVPDFSVQMNDGSTVTGALLREGVACIMFFNSECPDCSKTLVQMQPIYEKYAPQGVKFAFISRAEGEAEVSAHWKTNGYTMPYSAQSDKTVYNLFATRTIPRVFICLNGVVKNLFTDSPAPSFEEIDSAIKAAQSLQ